MNHFVDGMCSYNGKSYQQGQKWDDGCAYECTCDDANRGLYSCFNKLVLVSFLISKCLYYTKQQTDMVYRSFNVENNN